MEWPWNKSERNLDREMKHHLAMLADEYRRQGVAPEEAERRARIEFGGVEPVKEECRDIRWWSWMTHLLQDLRFGWRMLRKTPAITVSALLSLALGIGATTAIVSLANAVMWRSLAVPAPQQLLEVLWESKGPIDLVRGSSGGNFREGALHVADFFSSAALEAMRERTAGKAQIAAHTGNAVVSASYKGAVVVASLRPVSGNFFSTLKVQPARGRLLMERDDDPASAPSVVVTHRFWRRSLHESPDAIGRSIRINNVPYEIAGVLPPEFFGIVPGDETEIYTPIRHCPAWLAPDSWERKASSVPTSWWLQLIVRRAPETNPAELRALMDAGFAASWSKKPATPEATPSIRLSDAARGLGEVRREFAAPVIVLMGLVGLVLLMTCSNIANLLLARAVSREKEVALRVSLGCGEGRLVRQFFTESLLLALLGGALSIPVAAALVQLMATFMPGDFVGMLPSGVPDLGLLSATAAIAAAAAVLFGLFPSIRSSKVNSAAALKEGSGSGGTMSRFRWAPAKMLVLAQVALGVLLMTSAILYTSHLWGVVNRDAGFERGHLLLFDVRPGEAGFKGARLEQFYRDLERGLSGLAGVNAAGLARTRPMAGGGYWDGAVLPGQSKPVPTAVHHGNDQFLTALGVTLAQGRKPTAQEIRASDKVAVVSEKLAKDLGLASPLGTRVSIGDAEYQIIGVAKEARYSRLTSSPAIAYLPIDYRRDSATVVLRTTAPPASLLPAVRGIVKELHPELPLVDVYTMQQQIARTLQRERLFAWLCGSFGMLALVLCVVGLYGLFSHTTARRVPEIGIRIALGADRRDVVTQVLSEGVRLAVAGFVVGIPVALYCAKLAEKQKLLPEGAVPYWSLGASVALLAVSAIAAVLLPALRASSVDPMKALRQG